MTTPSTILPDKRRRIRDVMVTFFPLEADGGVGEAEAAFRAALVLLVSSPDKARAAATQVTFPLIAIVLLVMGLAM
jgi:hypothetical protein